MGKRMEGDTTQGRRRARDAGEAAATAGESRGTLGASNQDYRPGEEADHDGRMRGPGRGKQEPEWAANPLRPGSRQEEAQ